MPTRARGIGNVRGQVQGFSTVGVGGMGWGWFTADCTVQYAVVTRQACLSVIYEELNGERLFALLAWPGLGP